MRGVPAHPHCPDGHDGDLGPLRHRPRRTPVRQPVPQRGSRRDVRIRAGRPRDRGRLPARHAVRRHRDGRHRRRRRGRSARARGRGHADREQPLVLPLTLASFSDPFAAQGDAMSCSTPSSYARDPGRAARRARARGTSVGQRPPRVPETSATAAPTSTQPASASLEPEQSDAPQPRWPDRVRGLRPGLPAQPDLARERRRLERPTGGLRRLHRQQRASLSPDGDRIAFYRAFTDSLDAAIADPSLFGTVTVVNIDGSDLHELDTADRTKRCDVGPGRGRLVTGRHPDRLSFEPASLKPSEFVGQGIWTINSDGSEPRQVTRDLPGVARRGPSRRLVAGRQVA